MPHKYALAINIGVCVCLWGDARCVPSGSGGAFELNWWFNAARWSPTTMGTYDTGATKSHTHTQSHLLQRQCKHSESVGTHHLLLSLVWCISPERRQNFFPAHLHIKRSGHKLHEHVQTRFYWGTREGGPAEAGRRERRHGGPNVPVSQNNASITFHRWGLNAAFKSSWYSNTVKNIPRGGYKSGVLCLCRWGLTLLLMGRVTGFMWDQMRSNSGGLNQIRTN